MGEQAQSQFPAPAAAPIPTPNPDPTSTETHSQSQTPLPEPHDDGTAVETTTNNTTTPDVANAQPPSTSPASKIPSRPRKIRKLSPDGSEPQPSKNKIIPRVIPTKPLSSEGEIDNALRHLRNADPLLGPLIDLYHRPTFDSFHLPFLALAKSILYQQLAHKAGAAVYTRFIDLCGGESNVLPYTILALTPEQLAQIGVSARKTSYLQDLARKYQNGILSDSSIVQMDDKSLYTMLTMVNGIGSWSVHMFMIFSLHLPDVLPVSDLGVRKGVQYLYGLEELPKPSRMDQLCEKWRPYRSVASWYMWRLVEAKGRPSSAAIVSVAGTTSLQQQEQQQQQQQQHHLQQQQQFLDPINAILNLEACAGDSDWSETQSVF